MRLKISYYSNLIVFETGNGSYTSNRHRLREGVFNRLIKKARPTKIPKYHLSNWEFEISKNAFKLVKMAIEAPVEKNGVREILELFSAGIIGEEEFADRIMPFLIEKKLRKR